MKWHNVRVPEDVFLSLLEYRNRLERSILSGRRKAPSHLQEKRPSAGDAIRQLLEEDEQHRRRGGRRKDEVSCVEPPPAVESTGSADQDGSG